MAFVEGKDVNDKIIAFVTGASSGLGAEFCRQLASRCDLVIGVARRQKRLDELAIELDGSADFLGVEADLVTEEGLSRAIEVLRKQGHITYLVNNAGIGCIGDFSTLSFDLQQRAVRLHVEATICLCHTALPLMCAQGVIINVSSLASLIEGQGMAVYGATKSFLNYFSVALQAEVNSTGIQVQALCPGFVRTEFHDVLTSEGWDRDQIPEAMWQTPRQVVTQSLTALESGKILVVPGHANCDIARSAVRNQLSLLD